MPVTQAKQRQIARERTRNIKRSLRRLDSQIEVMQRRLDKILEVEKLITIDNFESFLKMFDEFWFRYTVLERVITSVMGLFLAE